MVKNKKMFYMNNKLLKFELRPADVVVAKKRKGLGRILNHYIVYAGDNTFIGNLQEGVKILSNDELETLLIDYEPIRINPFIGSEIERHKAIERAYLMIGKRYNIATFNCEHYANLVQKGVAKSIQVTATIVSLLILGFTYKVMRNNYGKR